MASGWCSSSDRPGRGPRVVWPDKTRSVLAVQLLGEAWCHPVHWRKREHRFVLCEGEQQCADCRDSVAEWKGWAAALVKDAPGSKAYIAEAKPVLCVIELTERVLDRIEESGRDWRGQAFLLKYPTKKGQPIDGELFDRPVPETLTQNFDVRPAVYRRLRLRPQEARPLTIWRECS